ncbi:hypothetical protein PSPO01_11285 [Paraphaeosphaeria sporulosa]
MSVQWADCRPWATRAAASHRRQDADQNRFRDATIAVCARYQDAVDARGHPSRLHLEPQCTVSGRSSHPSHALPSQSSSEHPLLAPSSRASSRDTTGQMHQPSLYSETGQRLQCGFGADLSHLTGKTATGHQRFTTPASACIISDGAFSNQHRSGTRAWSAWQPNPHRAPTASKRFLEASRFRVRGTLTAASQFERMSAHNSPRHRVRRAQPPCFQKTTPFTLIFRGWCLPGPVFAGRDRCVIPRSRCATRSVRRGTLRRSQLCVALAALGRTWVTGRIASTNASSCAIFEGTPIDNVGVLGSCRPKGDRDPYLRLPLLPNAIYVQAPWACCIIYMHRCFKTLAVNLYTSHALRVVHIMSKTTKCPRLITAVNGGKQTCGESHVWDIDPWSHGPGSFVDDLRAIQ